MAPIQKILVYVLYTLLCTCVLAEKAETGKDDNGSKKTLSTELQAHFIQFAKGGFDAHNHYRELHHASPLQWSDILAFKAQKLAYQMAVKGSFQGVQDNKFGLNVAKLTGESFNCDEAGFKATKNWYDQVKSYSFSDPRLNAQTDAFTQLIWKSSKEIGMGCAQRKGLLSNDVFVVALYYPPGNEVRSLRNNVLSDKKQINNAYASILSRKRRIAQKRDKNYQMKNEESDLKNKENKVKDKDDELKEREVKNMKEQHKGGKYEVQEKRKKIDAYIDLISQD